MNRVRHASFFLFGVCFFFIVWTWINYTPDEKIRCTTHECWKKYGEFKEIMREQKKEFESPLTHVKGILLGGVQRSGVNLLRTMLNAHPQIDCSHEINLTRWKGQDMTDQTVLYDIAKKVGAEIFKIDDQLVCIRADFEHIDVLSKVLPNIKFIVVIRDGRAVAHSMSTSDGPSEDFDVALNHWSDSLTIMLDQCYALGEEMCMVMIYEKLVVDTEVWIRAALTFTGLPWSSNVLNHSKVTGAEYYEKLGTIRGRLKEPVHSDSIDNWRPGMTEEELQRLFAMAPLLRKLGYPQ